MWVRREMIRWRFGHHLVPQNNIDILPCVYSSSTRVTDSMRPTGTVVTADDAFEIDICVISLSKPARERNLSDIN